ncbi:MAG: hypothetical protein JO010_10765 [Alphaproteobacteria bacterium]|nr:hypothetical protein [Alphaproteobacteria bacterium]
MRFKAVFALAMAAAHAGAAGAQEPAPPPEFCRALEAVAAEARRSGVAQEVSVVQDGDIMTFACTHRRTRSGRAFCKVAARTVSWEFTHVFPWMVDDCLTHAGVRPALERTDEYSGLVERNRIVRLRATLKGGVALDLRWEPFEDAKGRDAYRGIYRLEMRRAGPAERGVKR